MFVEVLAPLLCPYLHPPALYMPANVAASLLVQLTDALAEIANIGTEI